MKTFFASDTAIFLLNRSKVQISRAVMRLKDFTYLLSAQNNGPLQQWRLIQLPAD